MTDPLHVEVARSLGWTDIHPRTGGHWWGREPHAGMTICIPRYDTSFCSAGPLLQRMGITVGPMGQFWVAAVEDTKIVANSPTEAIARLIVAKFQASANRTVAPDQA